MDNLDPSDALQLEKNLNHEKVVHKRRSSIFQSRIISFGDCEGTQSLENEKSVNLEDARDTTLQEKPFNLEEYIISLKNERDAWIETLKQRKAQRRMLTKQKLWIESQGQLLDLDVLTESEKAFVAAQPNYQHICKNYKKISDMVLKMSLLRDTVYKLNQRFILQMNKRLCKLTEKVIETSET